MIPIQPGDVPRCSVCDAEATGYEFNREIETYYPPVEMRPGGPKVSVESDWFAETRIKPGSDCFTLRPCGHNSQDHPDIALIVRNPDGPS